MVALCNGRKGLSSRDAKVIDVHPRKAARGHYKLKAPAALGEGLCLSFEYCDCSLTPLIDTHLT